MDAVFDSSPSQGHVEDGFATAMTENGSTQENLGSQRVWPMPGLNPGGALELAQEIKEQQNGTEGGLGGVELAHAETVSFEIAFEFADAVLHVGPAAVGAPNLFWRYAGIGDEGPECVAWDMQKFSADGLFPFSHKFANENEAAFAIPAVQLQSQFSDRIILTQRSPVALENPPNRILDSAGHAGDDLIIETTILQKTEQGLIKETTVSPNQIDHQTTWRHGQCF